MWTPEETARFNELQKARREHENAAFKIKLEQEELAKAMLMRAVQGAVWKSSAETRSVTFTLKDYQLQQQIISALTATYSWGDHGSLEVHFSDTWYTLRVDHEDLSMYGPIENVTEMAAKLSCDLPIDGKTWTRGKLEDEIVGLMYDADKVQEKLAKAQAALTALD